MTNHLNTKKDFLNVLPINDVLSTDMPDRDFLDLLGSDQAKRLSQLHCWLWMNVIHKDDKENDGFVWESESEGNGCDERRVRV